MQDDLLLGGGVPPVGQKTDPRKYETIKCDKCGSIQFERQYIMKKVPGMEVGQGAKPIFVPMDIMVCAKCGAIWSEDIRGYKLENDLGLEQNQTEEKNSNIIV